MLLLHGKFLCTVPRTASPLLPSLLPPSIVKRESKKSIVLGRQHSSNRFYNGRSVLRRINFSRHHDWNERNLKRKRIPFVTRSVPLFYFPSELAHKSLRGRIGPKYNGKNAMKITARVRDGEKVSWKRNTLVRANYFLEFTSISLIKH